MRGRLLKVLTSFQNKYLVNLDGATYSVTSQRSEKNDFYCNHKKADSKMFVYIKLLCDNICLNIVSPDSDVAVYLCIKVSLTLHSQMHYGSKLVPLTIYLYTRIGFRNRITNILLASCNAYRMWLCQQFFTY